MSDCLRNLSRRDGKEGNGLSPLRRRRRYILSRTTWQTIHLCHGSGSNRIVPDRVKVAFVRLPRRDIRLAAILLPGNRE